MITCLSHKKLNWGGGGGEYTWPGEIMDATLLKCYTRNAIAEK